MKYVPPYGTTDPNAPYVNGNPAAGIEGSIPPADAFNEPLRELDNLVRYSGYTPADNQLDQVTRAIRRQFVNYAIDTGSVNALSISLQPAPGSYMSGTPIRVLVANTNTAACSINNSGLGIRAIKRPDGSDLQPGDIHAGGIATLVDDGSHYQLVNQLTAATGGSSVVSIKIPYCGDSSVTPNTITAVYSPAIATLTEGDFLAVKVNNTNTDATTMKVNALTPYPVYRNDGKPVVARDLLKDEALLLEFHGTYFQCVGWVASQFRLNANLTLYIRTDGNDLNDGSANDAGHAFKTIAAALAFVVNNMYLAGRTVTLQLGIAGTYDPFFPTTVPNGKLILRGDPANMDSYIIPSVSGGQCCAVVGCNVSVVGCNFQQLVGNNTWLSASSGGQLSLTNCSFTGASSSEVAINVFRSAEVSLFGTIKFQNNMAAALSCNGGSITSGNWSTLIQHAGGPNYSSGFAAAGMGGMITLTYGYISFSGVATGPRYLASVNSIINTFGGGEAFLPGNQPGNLYYGSWYF
jgi:hypothetical protein